MSAPDPAGCAWCGSVECKEQTTRADGQQRKAAAAYTTAPSDRTIDVREALHAAAFAAHDAVNAARNECRRRARDPVDWQAVARKLVEGVEGTVIAVNVAAIESRPLESDGCNMVIAYPRAAGLNVGDAVTVRKVAK